MADLETAIIGAGIVGLQMARRLYLSGEKEIAVFEKNPFPGEHSSSRNSGVLHAGIYYPKDSLKQKLCLEGNRLWDELAKELGISLLRPGKFIVSTNRNEDDELKNLFQFVNEKNVPGIRWATREEKEELSDFVNISNAFFSATTGVLSVSEAIKAFQNDLYQKDIPLLLSQPVVDLKRKGEEFELTVGEEKITAKKVINCAGLYAVEVRKMLGLDDLENYWVKGRYLKLNQSFYTKSLIYPIPQKNLKGLGVHTSFDFDRTIRFGPDTYDLPSETPSALADYSLDESVIDQMYPAISKVFKGIDKSALTLDYAGIRSKIKSASTGTTLTDFHIASPLPNYLEFLGIESPGLTASPAHTLPFSARKSC